MCYCSPHNPPPRKGNIKIKKGEYSPVLYKGRHVARVNASKAFGPFLLLEDMKGSLEEVKNKMMVDFDPLRCFVGDLEKEHSKKLKLWYDSLGGDAIGLTWERVGSMKREQEEASEEETDPIEVLKAVGELGKGFLKDIYSLKAPWLMS
ncbi:hypothetical protein KPL71_003659 [Citrus sinensis]|uniref:Uncharacterized protein n=1 Tax=Citrus sinensis TaxID=2711 RepID=A0ACB8MZB8_CITSI|nr:hypothetical protein KPL71_003659 [Citrus sinensis]